MVGLLGDWAHTLGFRRDDADTMATVALELTTRESRRYPPRVTWHLVEIHYKIFLKAVNLTAVLPGI